MTQDWVNRWFRWLPTVAQSLNSTPSFFPPGLLFIQALFCFCVLSSWGFGWFARLSGNCVSPNIWFTLWKDKVKSRIVWLNCIFKDTPVITETTVFGDIVLISGIPHTSFLWWNIRSQERVFPLSMTLQHFMNILGNFLAFGCVPHLLTFSQMIPRTAFYIL